MDEATRSKLEHEIKVSDVVLFMKGTPQAPRCGFSATVIGILDELGEKYHTVDVLSDPAVRDGIKKFSDWPTIPQLYIKGEFVGGCDLVKEMYESGELEDSLGVKPQSLPAPAINVTQEAMKALDAALKDVAAETGDDIARIRIGIGKDFQHELTIGAEEPRDILVEVGPLRFVLDRASARRADGLDLDYIEDEEGAAFKLNNPNEPPKVQSVSVEQLKEARDADSKLELFDVRSQSERDTAEIKGSRLLDRDTQDYIMTLDKGTPLYFHCHHGQRSQQAAAFFLSHGFANVFNVDGGIEAWSRKIDSNVPSY